jgi:hypothetical protein
MMAASHTLYSQRHNNYISHRQQNFTDSEAFLYQSCYDACTLNPVLFAEVTLYIIFIKICNQQT